MAKFLDVTVRVPLREEAGQRPIIGIGQIKESLRVKASGLDMKDTLTIQLDGNFDDSVLVDGLAEIVAAEFIDTEHPRYNEEE
jgi:hypothetical protein